MIAIGLLFGGKNFFIALSNKVLGTQTGPLLADQGSSGSDSNETSGGSGGSGDSGTNQGPQQPQPPTSNTLGAPNKGPLPPQPVRPTETPENNRTEPNQLQVETQGNTGQINLQTPGLHVELQREDNGALTVTAHQENGTEVQLHASALEQLNEALKEKDIEIATQEGSLDNLIIRKDGVIAQTALPISVDPTTHELTVTTPAGSKTVAVLPDQAVNNLLANKILTTVATQTSSQSGTVQTTQLTEVNNQPVFVVNGSLQQKVLGIIPVDLPKTALVSATNGQVIRVDESLLTRILGALSF